MKKIRINDLCRELEIKSVLVLRYLSEIGHGPVTKRSSIIEPFISQIRDHFGPALLRKHNAGPRTIKRMRGASGSIVPAAGTKAERQSLIERGLIVPTSGRSGRPVAKLPRERRRARDRDRLIICRICKGLIHVSERKKHLEQHVLHQSAIAAQPKPTVSIRAVEDERQSSNKKPRKEERCPSCGNLFHWTVFEQHLKDCSRFKLPDIGTAQYSFIILPPGEEWPYRKVFDHYRRQARSDSLTDEVIDWKRLEQLDTLKPSLRRFGVKSWFGYAVWEFSYSKRVVLECPVFGNATYVLWGNWQGKIRLSKGELRHKHPGQFCRIVHTGDWIGKVQRALRKG
jgi:hypothetical protein